MKLPLAAAIWIVLASFLTLGGWVLSALDALTRTGYLVWCSVGFAFGAFFFLWEFRKAGSKNRPFWSVKWSRFRRPFPALFAVVATVALVGGMTHAPNNHDALSYRLPRILNWTWESHWHWISSPFEMQNIAGSGYEWLMCPLLVFTKSDRFFFLISYCSFLLLPGLLFSFFVRMGVQRRVAYYWMWLLPCAYGFALQAGGIANDLLAVPYALAAVIFAFRAADTRSSLPALLALAAGALTTNVKASNLPLLLPVLVALVPFVRIARKRQLAVVSASLPLVAVISFLPHAFLNSIFSGSWKGPEDSVNHITPQSPLWGFVGNSLQLLSGSLQPPVMPMQPDLSRFVPSAILEPVRSNFEIFGLGFGELASDGTGLGLPISVLLVISVFASSASLFRRPSFGLRVSPEGAVLWAWAISAIAFMTMLSSRSTPRLFFPFYAFLVCLVLKSPINERLVRARSWQWVALISAGTVLAPLILDPSRPLLPVRTIAANLPSEFQQTHLAKRVARVYGTYATRADAMQPLRPFLSSSERSIGLMHWGRALPVGLWKPFGTRKVEYLPPVPLPTRETFELKGIRTIVLRAGTVGSTGNFVRWLSDLDARIVGQAQINDLARYDPEIWYVVRLNR